MSTDADPLTLNLLHDLFAEDTLHDLFGDGGSSGIYNLLLETGDDFLLEDGSFILLE